MKSKITVIKPGRSKFMIVIAASLSITIFASLNVAGQKSTADKKEITPPAGSTDKQTNKGMKDGAYQVVDQMPVFPGGDAALLKYIADSTRYPKEARAKGIQGKVIARFKVNKDGSVSNVSVLREVDPMLDNESIRVVKSLPRFTPGKLKGKNVPVWYMVPINYSLK
jgi:periplasmic protein TonB